MALQKSFQDVLERVKKGPYEATLSPELDKVDEKDVKLFSEMEALSSGALLAATVEQGEGDDVPQEGDLVFVHMKIETEGGKKVFTTNPDGPHSVFGFILEKSPRMPRGLEVSVKEMRKDERRALKVTPEFFFQHPECEFHLPEKDQAFEKEKLMVDLRLVRWYFSDSVSHVGYGEEYILKHVLKQGEGWENPRPPYEVTVSFTGRSPSSNGAHCGGDVLFKEESVERAMGSDSLPKGIQAAITSMVRCEHAVFVMPIETFSKSEEGLVFSYEGLHQVEVEIILHRVTQVRDMYGDGKVIKRRMTEGVGEFPVDCPMEDCHVKLSYKARPLSASKTQSEVWTFDSSSFGEVDVELGCGELPDGVEGCLRLMLPGETSRLQCTAAMAYSNSMVEPPAGISEVEDVEFEIFLHSFDRESMWAGAQDAQKIIELGKTTKEIANGLYKKAKYKLARMKYQKIVRGFDAFRNYEEEDEVIEADEIKLACLGNIALCYTQEGDYAMAVEGCDKALSMNEENPKILLRRGRAMSLKGNYDEAEKDFLSALQIDATLKNDVDQAIAANKQRLKAALKKQKGDFNFFF